MDNIYSILDKTSITFDELEELTYNESVVGTSFNKIWKCGERIYNLYIIMLSNGDSFSVKVVM